MLENKLGKKQAVLGIVGGLCAFMVLLVIIGACTEPSEESSTESPATIFPTPSPTAVITATALDKHFGVGRQEVYKRFKNLNIGLLPLNRHTDEWYSTSLPDVGIMIDIFGPSSGVQTIEAIFKISPAVAAKMDHVDVVNGGETMYRQGGSRAEMWCRRSAIMSA